MELELPVFFMLFTAIGCAGIAICWRRKAGLIGADALRPRRPSIAVYDGEIEGGQ